MYLRENLPKPEGSSIRTPVTPGCLKTPTGNQTHTPRPSLPDCRSKGSPPHPYSCQTVWGVPPSSTGSPSTTSIRQSKNEGTNDTVPMGWRGKRPGLWELVLGDAVPGEINRQKGSVRDGSPWDRVFGFRKWRSRWRGVGCRDEGVVDLNKTTVWGGSFEQKTRKPPV